MTFMGMIKGITVTLYERRETGVDGFGNPTYTEEPVEVENVVVNPSAENDIADSAGVLGRRAEYELFIPKGDTHNWENNRVDFFGGKWRVFGAPLEYMESMLPLEWNKRVKVERYE